MKVVCDNCRAVYKVPNTKLVKAVNKATCRNCSHRMLIPRPKPGANPDERMLVTAVPPTPPGAAPRAASPSRGGRSAAPPPRYSAHNIQRPSRSPRSSDWEDGPATKIKSNSAADQPTRALPDIPPPGGVPLRRAPAPKPRPAPSPARTGANTRSPPPSSQRTESPRGYDPSGDLIWALFGTGMSLLGATLLAVLSVVNHPMVMWFGLAFAFGGGVLTFTVLMTGNRGRRPARSTLGVVLGFLSAVGVASVMVGTKVGAEYALDQINFSNQQGLENAVVQPTTAPRVARRTAPQPQPTAATQRAVPSKPTRPRPAPSPRPAPTEPAPRAQPVPITGTLPPNVLPEPDPVPEPVVALAAAPPPPPPEPEGMAAVPLEAVHVMLRNNLQIKGCFLPLMRAGALPPRVDIKFNILPPGNVTGVQLIKPEKQVGTEFEACLRTTVGAIAFPPTTGNGTQIVYPFILK